MPTMRLALAPANATVGDLAGNATLIMELAQQAHQGGADLIAFPEMFLTGYLSVQLSKQHFLRSTH